MKNILSQITVGVVVIILGWGIFNWITTPTADIRYTLLEPIAVKIADTPQYIQQLDIKNLGKLEATNLNIRIDASNLTCDVIKYSQADDEKIYVEENQTEISYPKLPPGGEIKIILKSSTNYNVNTKNIDIGHDKGKAKEILSSTNTDTIKWFFILIMAIYIALSINSWRSTILTRYERNAYTDPDRILKKRKPFYASEEDWKSIRADAIRRKVHLGIDYINEYEDIDKNENYKFLSMEQPGYLDDNEWRQLLEASAKTFEKFLRMNLANGTILDKTVLPDCPKYYSVNAWNSFSDKYFKKYINEKIEKIFRFKIKDDIITAIGSQKPNQMKQEIWDDYIKELKKVYYESIASNLIYESEPIKYLKTENLDILPTSKNNEILKQNAYRLQMREVNNINSLEEAQKFIANPKPEWIRDLDYRTILNHAENIVELEHQKKSYKMMYDILQNIIYGEDFPVNKPDSIDVRDWTKLKEFDARSKELEEKSQDVLKKESELASSKNETEDLKRRVIRQLEIINSCLVDETTLDRVEDYENIFAPGNIANLKLITSALKTIRAI